MEIEKRQIEGIVVLNLFGDLMGDGSEKLKKVIKEEISKENINFVINMQRVIWMNSVGLGGIINSLTQLRAAGGDLRVCGLPERIKRPLEITKLDTVIKNYDSLEQAINSFSGEA